jgi:hypothetical protein
MGIEPTLSSLEDWRATSYASLAKAATRVDETLSPSLAGRLFSRQCSSIDIRREKSGRQDLNLRPRASEARALRKLSYALKIAEGVGFEPTHRSLNRRVPYRLGYPSSNVK